MIELVNHPITKVIILCELVNVRISELVDWCD